MIRRYWLCLILLSMMFGVTLMTTAQGAATCSAIVQRALDSVGQNCAEIGRNNACYGYDSVSASFSQTADPAVFDQPSDIAALRDLQTIVTAPLDEASGKWGVAVLKVQANLPDTMPGQAVTFLLLGDAEVANGVAPDDSEHTPMQVFYFRTGPTSVDCVEAPNSLLVQGPQNTQVNLTVNGADVTIGSTVQFISMQEAPDHIVSNLTLPTRVDERLRTAFGEADADGEACHLMHLRVVLGEARLNDGVALPAGNAAWAAYCLRPRRERPLIDRIAGRIGQVDVSFASEWGSFRQATQAEWDSISYLNRLPPAILSYPIKLPPLSETVPFMPPAG